MLNKKMTAELQALLDQQAEIERRIREAEQAQRDRKTRAAKIASKRGGAYVELVLDLFEVLAVAEEHPRTRTGRGGASVEVPADPGDELRLSRLRQMLEQIITSTDASVLERLKRDDEAGRIERHEQREAARASADARRQEGASEGVEEAAEAGQEEVVAAAWQS